MHSQPWREDAAFRENQAQGTGHPVTALTCFCPLEKEQECEWRKRAAELKGNTGKGKDKEEEVGFKAEWGPAISEEEKKEVEKERQNEKVRAGGSSRTTRQKGNRTRKSYNHVDWNQKIIQSRGLEETSYFTYAEICIKKLR